MGKGKICMIDMVPWHLITKSLAISMDGRTMKIDVVDEKSAFS